MTGYLFHYTKSTLPCAANPYPTKGSPAVVILIDIHPLAYSANHETSHVFGINPISWQDFEIDDALLAAASGGPCPIITLDELITTVKNWLDAAAAAGNQGLAEMAQARLQRLLAYRNSKS